jgi:hypothetical protein
VKARRAFSGSPSCAEPFDIGVHAIASIQLKVVELADMNGLEVTLCAAYAPLAAPLLALNQHLKQAMHGDTEVAAKWLRKQAERQAEQSPSRTYLYRKSKL